MKIFKSSHNFVLPLVITLIFLLLTSLNIHSNTMKGLADNHDFQRMMVWIGVAYPKETEDEKYINWINRYYDIQKTKTVVPVSENVYSSEVLFLLLARAVNSFVSISIFDIKILGIIHTIFFSSALFFTIYYLQKIYKYSFLIIGPFIFLVLTDTTYTAYFNTFYQESAGIISLFALIALQLKIATDSTRAKLVPTFLAFLFFSCLLISAKSQYFPLFIPIAASMLLLYNKVLKKKILYVSILFLIAFSFGVYSLGTPPIIKKWNVYNTLFAQLLGNTNNVSRASRILNIDSSLVKYSGIPAYFSGNGIDDPDVQKYLNSGQYFNVMRYYLLTPSEAIKLITELSKKSFITRVDFLGYYELNKGEPPAKQPEEFVVWSSFKSDIFSVLSPINLLLLVLGLFLSIYMYFKNKKKEIIVGFFIISSALMQFFVVLTSEGTFGIPEKHLFLYNILFDLTLLYWAMVLFLAGKNLRNFNFIRSLLKENKYGSNKIKADQSHFGTRRALSKRGRGASGKVHVASISETKLNPNK